MDVGESNEDLPTLRLVKVGIVNGSCGMRLRILGGCLLATKQVEPGMPCGPGDIEKHSQDDDASDDGGRLGVAGGQGLHTSIESGASPSDKAHSRGGRDNQQLSDAWRQIERKQLGGGASTALPLRSSRYTFHGARGCYEL